MEYIFGINNNKEILKTKGKEHSDLSGIQTMTREYSDQNITDKFRIVSKYLSKEDREGNCYDWYEISEHSRVCDKSPSIRKETEKTNAMLQYIAMMADVELPEDNYNE